MIEGLQVETLKNRESETVFGCAQSSTFFISLDQKMQFICVFLENGMFEINILGGEGRREFSFVSFFFLY